MNPTTGTGEEISRGRTPTMSYLSFSGSMSLSMSMPISISPFSSRLEVFDYVVTGGGRDALSSGAEFDLTLRGDLVGNAELIQRFQRSLPGDREVGVLISDAPCRQERFLDRSRRGDVGLGLALWDVLRSQ